MACSHKVQLDAASGVSVERHPRYANAYSSTGDGAARWRFSMSGVIRKNPISPIHGMNGDYYRLFFMRIPYASNTLSSACQVRVSPSTLALMSPFSDAPGGTL